VAIDVSPAALVDARRELEGGEYYE
jgi:hypothetical protein